jgi:hypothetical protein
VFVYVNFWRWTCNPVLHAYIYTNCQNLNTEVKLSLYVYTIKSMYHYKNCLYKYDTLLIYYYYYYYYLSYSKYGLLPYKYGVLSKLLDAWLRQINYNRFYNYIFGRNSELVGEGACGYYIYIYSYPAFVIILISYSSTLLHLWFFGVSRVN